jgi:transposase-like protein
MPRDRGIIVAPTVMRWVVRYAPEFEKRWRRYERPVGFSWRIDETYIKVAGITLDAYAASHRAVQELKDSGEIFYQRCGVHSCAHLNNIVGARPSAREKLRAADAWLQNIPQCTRRDRRD